MKKIRNITLLNAEQKKLKQRQAELEKAITYDWRDVKESLKPKIVARQVFTKVFDEKEKQKGHSIFSDGIAEIAAKFAQRMTDKAGEKIGKWFKK